MNSRRPRSLADYPRAARRRKLILVVPALVLAIAIAMTLRDLPNLYESTARMRFTSVKTDGASDLSVHLRQFREHLTSRDTLATLISKNNLSAESSESVISQMRGRIAVEPDASREAQPGAFTLSYRATDPETARKTTDEMADRLVTLSSKEPSLALSEAEVVRKRATDIAIQLWELEHKDPWLTGVRSDLSVTTPSLSSRSSQPSPEAIRAQQMTIDSLKDQQYKIHQQLAGVDRRITAQRQIVEQQKKGSTLRDNPTYAVLIAKRAERASGFHIVGFVDNKPELIGKSLINPKVIGLTADIGGLVEQYQVDRIVVAVADRRGMFPTEELLSLSLSGRVAVEESARYYERLTGKIASEMLRPSWLIFSRGNRFSDFEHHVRRVLNAGFAAVGFVLSLPIMLLTALAVKLDSRGPVFYVQERVGKNGRTFKIIKFRSMRVGGEAKSGPVWAEEDDPRVTRVGRVIRKLRFDELPQFVNVIRGNMNFVGPRPERPMFVEQLGEIVPYYSQRHVVKPGLTGCAKRNATMEMIVEGSLNA